jgi:glycosyltransferase involved in cell wall biosynthesis
LKKLLALVPLPPPYSGPEISSKILFSKPFDNLKVKLINVSVRKNKLKRGTFSPSAFLKFSLIYINYIFQLVFYNPHIIYHCITATKFGWIRDFLILFPSIMLNKRIILHMRGGHFKIFYENLNSKIFKKLIKFCLDKSHKIIVQSESLRGQFENYNSKLEVLPNPFEEMFLNISPKREGKRILFVGLLTYAKGYNDLLKVAIKILNEFNEIEFIFLGERMEKETNIFYNQITGEKLNIEPFFEIKHPRITYISQAFGYEKLRIYEISDIFVLPSYSEGFSMAVLEAMVSGLAVITTPVGANKDIIKHLENGILINPGDRESLYHYIKLLILDKNLREKISKNARKFAIENFHPDIVRKKFLEIALSNK